MEALRLNLNEPGGYFGAVFSILRELGKPGLAGFRMNDAHFTSPDIPLRTFLYMVELLKGFATGEDLDT